MTDKPSPDASLPNTTLSSEDWRGQSDRVVVRFDVPGKPRQFTASAPLLRGARVVVQTKTHRLLGTVSRGAKPKWPIEGSIVGVAQPQDERLEAAHTTKALQAQKFCETRLAALQLEMKIVALQISHDGALATLLYTCNTRVDYRTLLKDLSRHLGMAVQMRQLGVRDAARHTGGTGLCGRSLCCSTWLPKFEPVGLRMAKDQNLALNQDKLAGLCGRLRCCLQYEQKTYEAERRTLPKVGARVQTPSGPATIKDVNIIRRRLGVVLDGKGYDTLDAAQVTLIEP